MKEPIIEEGICTFCGRRTKVALLELWEDQDRGVVEMNVAFCTACLTRILEEIRKSHKDTKTIIREGLNASIQHLYNAMDKNECGEIGFCLEEIQEAVHKLCSLVEIIENS